MSALASKPAPVRSALITVALAVSALAAASALSPSFARAETAVAKTASACPAPVQSAVRKHRAAARRYAAKARRPGRTRPRYRRLAQQASHRAKSAQRRCSARLRRPVRPSKGAPRMGIVSSVWGPDSGRTMKAHVAMGRPPVRADFAIETDPATQDAVFHDFAAHGLRPLVLASFPNRLPDPAATQRFCSGMAARFGPGGSEGLPEHLAVRHIEFGNESYYQPATKDAPEGYARAFRVCAQAARQANPRVGVLAQSGDVGDANWKSPNWVDRMYSAVPELNELVAGWTAHPYGPKGRSDWVLRFARDYTAAHGSSAPIFVTEYGIASDDGRCLSDNYSWDPCISYAGAANALVSTMERWKRDYPRIAEVYYYEAADQRAPGVSSDREHYFGLTQRDGTPKGPLYTAFKSYVLSGS